MFINGVEMLRRICFYGFCVCVTLNCLREFDYKQCLNYLGTFNLLDFEAKGILRSSAIVLNSNKHY